MMSGRILPNLGLTAFYNLGDSTWADGVSLNFLKLSVLTQGGILGIVNPLPTSPNPGDTYIVGASSGENANTVAVYDNGSWVYFFPQEGWTLYNQGTNQYISYIGLVWVNTNAQLLAEIARAESAESALSASISGLSTSITAETARAESAESALSASISGHSSSISGLSTSITAETARAESAESVLSNGITAEVARAEGAESSLSANITALSTSISTETIRAETAEALLVPIASLGAHTGTTGASLTGVDDGLSGSLFTTVQDGVDFIMGLTMNVKQRGAQGDGIQTTCTINGGALSTVIMTGTSLTSANIGNTILIRGASSGAPLSAIITAVINPTTCTISSPASGAVSGAICFFGTDDTANCVASINSGAKRIIFPAGIYMLAGLGEIPAGITIQGGGWSANSGSPTTGTILCLTANVPMYTITGISITAGGPQKSGNQFHDILIDGNNFTSDLCVEKAVSYRNESNIYRRNSLGRLLWLVEVFDSNIYSPQFEWGGSSDGTIPAVHIQSGPGTTNTYEFTNVIRWWGARLESVRGTGIFIDGGAAFNTNKMYFYGLKIESEMSNVPLLVTNGAVLISFNNAVIAGQGTAGNVLSELVLFQNSRQIQGVINVEKVLGGATIATYINHINCTDMWYDVAATGGEAPTSGFLISSDGVNPQTYGIRVTENIPGGKAPTQCLTQTGTMLEWAPAGSTPTRYMEIGGISDNWSTGVEPDGSGLSYVARHGGVAVYQLQDNNVVSIPQNILRIGAAHVQTTSSGLPASIPQAGEFIWNTTPVVGGPLGFMGITAGTPGVAVPVYGQYLSASSQGAAFTPDFLNQGSQIQLTLTGNVAIANPTTTTVGRAGTRLILVQDATGGHSPTFGTQYIGLPLIGSGAANQIGILDLQCNVIGGVTTWNVVSWSGWGVPQPQTNVVTFNASGTYTPSINVKSIDVVAVGSGGGGGGGAKVASGTAASGAGGGGGGACIKATLLGKDLPGSVAITIGPVGTAGVAATSSSTNGANGGTGGNAVFGGIINAYGGGGGAGGQIGTASGGGGGGGLSGTSSATGATGSTGGLAAGNGGSGASGGSAFAIGGGGGGGCDTTGTGHAGNGFLVGGGGAGGGVTTAAAGVASYSLATLGAAQSAIGVNGNSPASLPMSGGSGGGGGNGGFAANAGAAGNGTAGSGGGGGGTATNLFSASSGGSGGSGYIIIIEHF